MGFIGENLGKAKGSRFFLFFPSHMGLLYYRVSIGIRSG